MTPASSTQTTSATLNEDCASHREHSATHKEHSATADKNSVQSIKNRLPLWRVGLIAGCLFFSLHFGINLYHVYFLASKQNQQEFSHIRDKRLPEPQRWHNILDLNRWDSAYYEIIVKQGYEKPELTSWFPALPLLASLILMAVDWPVTQVFSLISLLATLGFWLTLWHPRFMEFFKIKVLILISVFTICWPGSYYWFAGMTEPLIGLGLLWVLLALFYQRFLLVALILALGTLLKHGFVPIALVVYGLQTWKNRQWRLNLVYLGLGLSGFLGFCIYSAVRFDNFLMPLHQQLDSAGKTLSLWNIVNLNHYGEHMNYFETQFAFLAMMILLFALLRIRLQRSEIVSQVQAPSQANYFAVAIFMLAACYTCFLIYANATSANNPFASFMRLQTANTPFFLLLGLQFRQTPWWKIALFFFPILWILFLKQQFLLPYYWDFYWIS